MTKLVTTPLIELADVKKYYAVQRKRFSIRGKVLLRAVDGVSLNIHEGETLALIGESGCGKTTISKMILRLEAPTGGRVLFDGKDIFSLSKTENLEYRRSLQAVSQNPYASLNPRMKIRDVVAEPLIASGLMSWEKAKLRVSDMLSQVGLKPESADLYPHEFSGGQRQRIAVARALVTKPRFVVLDEPVSALDVSIRAQIMNLMQDLQKQLGMGYLLISHDLATAIHLSRRVVVIYSGKVVENINADQLYQGALHPYTLSLLKAASPQRLRDGSEEFILRGDVADPLNPPSGCTFHPRCPNQISRCQIDEPFLRAVEDEHFVRCHLVS